MRVDLNITISYGHGAEDGERVVTGVEVPLEPHIADVLILEDPRLADLAGLRVVRRRVWEGHLELMCEAWPRKSEAPDKPARKAGKQ